MEITREEIDDLVDKYFHKDGYEFANNYDHRYDQRSSKQCYSLIRDHKPTSCLEFGTSRGGSTSFIQAALIKNKKPFQFIASEMEKDLLQQAITNVFRERGTTPMFIGKVEKYLRLIPKKLDFVFIDTNHDLKNTKWYIKHIFPRIVKGGLVAIHDWAVQEVDGKLIGKGHDGVGGWDETNYLMDLVRKGEFPLEKLYWSFEEGDGFHGPEASFWLKK